jgi:hypothetical protein
VTLSANQHHRILYSIDTMKSTGKAYFMPIRYEIGEFPNDLFSKMIYKYQ